MLKTVIALSALLSVASHAAPIAKPDLAVYVSDSGESFAVENYSMTSTLMARAMTGCSVKAVHVRGDAPPRAVLNRNGSNLEFLGISSVQSALMACGTQS